jgi:hypothetical protein
MWRTLISFGIGNGQQVNTTAINRPTPIRQRTNADSEHLARLCIELCWVILTASTSIIATATDTITVDAISTHVQQQRTDDGQSKVGGRSGKR